MSQSSESKKIIGLLATAAIACGATGIGVIGGFSPLVAELSKTIFAGFSVNIGSGIIGSLKYSKLREWFIKTHPNDLNHDLQKALKVSIINALENIRILYSSYIKDNERQRLNEIIKGLKKEIEEGFPDKKNEEFTKVELKDYLYDDPDLAIELLLKELPFKLKDIDTLNTRVPFSKFLKENLLIQLQLCFGEMLKERDNYRIWVAFQRLIIEDIRENVELILIKQEELHKEILEIKKRDVLFPNLSNSQIKDLTYLAKQLNNPVELSNELEIALNNFVKKTKDAINEIFALQKKHYELGKEHIELSKLTLSEIQKLSEQFIVHQYETEKKLKTKRIVLYFSIPLILLLLASGMYFNSRKNKIEVLEKKNNDSLLLDISMNPTLGKEINLYEGEKNNDTSNMGILSFDMEFNITNNNPTNINITEIRWILNEATEFSPEIYLTITGSFRRSKYSDDNPIDLPFFIESGQSLKFYCYVQYPVSNELNNLLMKEIKRIQKDTVYFVDINNFLIPFAPKFNCAFMINDKYFQYHQGQLTYEVENLEAEEYYKRGLEKDSQKDFSGSIIEYTKAITINPALEEAYCDRGHAKCEIRDFKGGMTDFTLAIAINPDYARAYFNRGVSKANLQDNIGAIEDYNKAIELNPQYEVAYCNRGGAKCSIQDFQGAILDFNKAITIDPQDIVAYLNRGTAKVELEDYKGAIEDYTTVIEINPKYSLAYFLRGTTKLDLGQNDNGCIDLHKAGELGYSEAYEEIKEFCK